MDLAKIRQKLLLGNQSNNRFELAIAFLKDANQAEKYAQQESAEGGRDFLKKIGSNFRIADRTLVLDFKNTFKIAEKYHADPANAGEDSYDFTKSENWRCLFEKIRTGIAGGGCPNSRRQPPPNRAPFSKLPKNLVKTIGSNFL